MIYSVRAISCLSVLVLATLKGSLGSQGLWLSLEEIEDLNRGPELGVALLAKQRAGTPLSTSDMIFAGLETIRGVHLTFEAYKRTLTDPRAMMEMMAMMSGASAEAAPSEFTSRIQPLVESTQSLLVSIQDYYPVVPDPTDRPEVTEAAQAKMYGMVLMDVLCTQTLFAPEAVSSQLASVSDRAAKIGVAQVMAGILMQAAMMTDSLTCITRDAGRVVPLQEGIIFAATNVKAVVLEAIGSDESTKIVELGFDNAINACKEYKKILEDYKETGVWIRDKTGGSHGPIEFD